MASGVQSTLTRRILYGVDRPPRGVAWDHPRLPSVVLDAAPLRLNSVAVPPAILAGGTERASRLAAVQAWLAHACGDYARARVQFVSAYLDFARASPTGPELDARVAQFGGLYATEDWTWSALRPLPRAWIEGPSGPLMADIAFWDGQQVFAVQLGGADAAGLRAAGVTMIPGDALAQQLPASFRDAWRSDILPSSPFRRPIGGLD